MKSLFAALLVAGACFSPLSIGHAAEDAGKDISEEGEKSGKVTVYYTERAGHKIAHFFRKTL